MFDRLREDIATVLEKDPAARSWLEVLLCCPGVHVLVVHRVAHACWGRGFLTLGRFLSHLGRMFTGIEIHPAARIGRRVFLDHGMGIVIGETAEVGDECTIYQGVTLGGTSLNGGKRHPTLASGVVVGAGAKVLGPFTVGRDAKIGSNSVVVKAVPAGATAVGIPARILIDGREASHGLAESTSQVPDSALVSSDVTRSADTSAVDSSSKSGEPRRAPAANPTAAAATNNPRVRRRFAAYAVVSGADDPLSIALHRLIDHVAEQDRAIEELRCRLKEMGADVTAECPPIDAADLSRMVD